jgi:glycosyltransferase involved in cell wall biosynthesis
MQTRPQKKAICHLLHVLRVGGAELLAARLARRLRGDFDFLFVCLDELGSLADELRAEGFPVHLLGRRPGVDWRCSLRLAKLLRSEGVGLLHAHQYTPFFYGMTARLLYRRPPVLFTEHGRLHPDYPRPKRMLANRVLLERRDHVVGVGEAVRQALLHNEGLPPGRVGVLSNGIDLTAFSNHAAERLDVRRELGVGPADFVLIQVARLDTLKDHATAVRTLERVVRQRPDARLVLVGEGPERAALEELVRQRGLVEHVRFLGLRRDIPRLLAAADLCLLTSVSEGIPLTLIEAMAAGLPVVATSVGGVGEVVANGDTGLLAPAMSELCLSDAILRLAGDANLRRQMSQRGRARAAELFSEEQMLGSYRRLYCEMVGA